MKSNKIEQDNGFKIGDKVRVVMENKTSVDGFITAFTTLGMYVRDLNMLASQTYRGEWFSYTSNQIFKI